MGMESERESKKALEKWVTKGPALLWFVRDGRKAKDASGAGKSAYVTWSEVFFNNLIVWEREFEPWENQLKTP